MDVNNTPYHLLRSEDEFEQGSSHLNWHAELQALTLAQNQTLRLPEVDVAEALNAWQNSTPLALDSYNQVARLNAADTLVEVNSGHGYLPLQDAELQPLAAPSGTLRDLQLSADGLLSIPYSNSNDIHGLLLFHLAQRNLSDCSLPAVPLRSWIDDKQRVWCLGNDSLMLCQGQPLPLPYHKKADRFEPLTVNPDALRLVWQQDLPAGWLALALTGDDDHLYLLCHDGGGNQAILSRNLSQQADSPFKIYTLTADIPFVIDLSLASPGRLAAVAPAQNDDIKFVQRDCPVLALRWNSETETGRAELIRERYPMLSLAVPRFVSSADQQLRYQAQVDADFPDIDPRPRELHALRQSRFFRNGEALLNTILDSGQNDAIWHRVYLDACIPPGCEINLSVRVYNTPEQRAASPLIDQPTPLWNPLPSELPFAQPLAELQPGNSGLFEILLQRSEGPIRRLSGRYLQIQLQLQGDGRRTPALHAIRIYYQRFSYQEMYLPELYRQELNYDEDNDSGPANGADIRERMLAALEGILTPIEGRIAASQQLVHPDATASENLPWLAELLGHDLAGSWPTARQRNQVKHTTLLQQNKGTLAGVNLALDIACDGSVRRGEIVVLENFRLRRSMATLLGINMDDSDHPLTLGTGMSGNSIIGDSLILSESDALEFLALFAPELADKEETEAVQLFFEQYAHQVSILLHGNAISRRANVETVLAQYMPAHLQWRIIESERPFVLGIAPLLAVDTFIENTPANRQVQLNDTRLGLEGVLQNPLAFDSSALP